MLPDFNEINKHDPAIAYMQVDGTWDKNVNQEEAQEVCHLVEQLLSDNPTISIGIVTFNAKQQLHIMDTLEAYSVERNFTVPDGYNVEKADVALLIHPTYPTAQIDMAYFFPALIRNDRAKIKALANQSIEGKIYQRWSRHRTPQNPWRSGLDDVSTHLELVKNWLLREFKK